jgi:hypothetical protein
MNASPETARLSDEELDLLLSRALDGDLAPDEERELAILLAADPRAARRREELAGLVGKLNALPVPAPPLGLTARVGAWTAERAKGMGAAWHRLGLFPPPSMVRGIAALFVIVLIGIGVLRSQGVRQKAAEEAGSRDEGRVAIFFDEKKPSAPAAPVAASRPEPPAKIAAAKEKAEPARREAPPAAFALEKKDTKEEDRAGAVAGLATNAPRGNEGFAADALKAQEETAGAGGAVRNEAASGKPMALAAQAAPPAPVRAAVSVPLAWDVEIVGPSARAWALRRIAAPAPTAAGLSASYRLTLDAGGTVVAVRAVEGATPEVDAFVRSLVFTPLGPKPPAEIEVAVRTR